MPFQEKRDRFKSEFADFFAEKVNVYKYLTLIIFILIITALAWQSDDAYHAYVMAKNLVDGNGFVYNIGERATASSCPLFTLVVALGYFVFRNMFLVSLLICVIFSAAAYGIIMKNFCKTRSQVIYTFITLVASGCFISYTTSGLENSQLFFLAALFLKYYFKDKTYTGWQMFRLGVLVALIAMTRMDAVLMFIPMILYVYLAKREKVSFIKAVGIGILSLMPFILWELFSVFYFGFPVPNTAYVKLGTDIPKTEYLVRGMQYLLTSAMCDILLLAIPVMVIVFTLIIRKIKYIHAALGIFLYILYIFYIGGDFMLGRHFTVLFLMAVIVNLEIQNKEMEDNYKYERLRNVYIAIVVCGVAYTVTTDVVTDQFLYGHEFNSPISDERAGYFKYTSLFNNAVSYIKTGDMCIREAWNEGGIEEYRERGIEAGILKMVPGISIYYNNDLYLNDQYALGDPFLSKLPAVREDNWRIGHMWREVPPGYGDTVMFGGNHIEDPDLAEYYDVITLITRGKLFDSERIKAVINMNLGKYDYLLNSYINSLDENQRLVQQ